MKRFALILAGIALVGCSHNDNNSCPACDANAAPQTQPAAAGVGAAAVTADPAAPAVPVTPPVKPADKITFELTQDGKVYVFGSVAAMQSFQAGRPQAKVIEQPTLTPSGKTVVIEAADDAEAAQIAAAYMKLHPAPAK
jgi:hypothetical protein